jgi:hypothetical protein
LARKGKRHGLERIAQKENRLGMKTNFQVQGFKKKFDSMSTGQLRNRFPQFGHLNDVELRKHALQELLNKK